MPAAQPFPPQAISWLTGAAEKILLVGAVPSVLRRLPGEITVIDSSMVALNRCQGYGARLVSATAHALPFEPEQFDVCLFTQNLHTVEQKRAFAQIARVLRPGGQLACIYTTRDDTVPWVKRLAALLQSVDASAMTGDYGTASAEAIEQSHYFPNVEKSTFRTWHPMPREGLLQMVQRRPALRTLDDDRRAQLLADVAELYDSMARPPEPLLLPYQALCWRATVCQDEMSVPITYEDGLKIF